MPSSSTDSSKVASSGAAAAARYCAIFGLGLLAAIGFAEYMIRTHLVLGTASWESRVHQVYAGSSPNAVIGDSHVYRGFIGEADFENLARDNTTPISMEILAREYFRFRDPERVIVGASPQFFRLENDAAGAQLHDGFFGQNLSLPFQLYFLEPGIARAMGKLWNLKQLEKDTSESLARTKPRSVSERYLSVLWRNLSPEQQKTRLQLRAMFNAPMPNVEQTENYAAYVRMLAFLIERGAKVCLVETPVLPAYRDFVDAVGNSQQRLRDIFGRLSTRLAIPYVGPQHIGPPMPGRYFYDQDHLTAVGAREFARRALPLCFPDRSRVRARDTDAGTREGGDS